MALRLLSGLAWQMGRMAALDNEQRVVPDRWQKYAREWLAGYDNKRP